MFSNMYFDLLTPIPKLKFTFTSDIKKPKKIQAP